MLDLNVNIITSTDPSCDGKEVVMEVEKVVVPQGLKTQIEDSETSSSSVVNAEEVQTQSNNVRDEDSSNNSSAFIFDILKSGKDGFCSINCDKVENPSPELGTRSLFPVTGVEEGKEVQIGLGLSSRPQCLNLSFADSEGHAAELRLTQQQQQPVRKSRRGPRSRSSQYRGVTFYRRTGRWESHIWDCGKQVYLGGFDTAHAAARAYDKAAVKFRGVDADINFSVSDYEEDMKQTRNLTKEEFVQTLRRQSNGFSRANSKYRGVTTLQKFGRWEAQTGQFIGNKGIQCNEGVTKLQPRMYRGEIVSNSNTIDDSEHNLDLSLGISMSSNGTKRNYPLVWNACDIPNREVRPKVVDNSASGGGQIPFVSSMSSKYPSTCSGGIYPGLLPKHEEKAKENSDEAVSSPRLMSWAWQVQSNTSHNVAPMPMFSIAASSGFPSSTNYVPPANLLPLNRQSNFGHNLFSSMSTTFATDNSHSSYKH